MKKGLIANIQGLRAFAALSVVFLHATSRDGLDTSITFGKYGVDLFFVISGFIMCQITSVGDTHFLLKRAIRIVPAYWTITIMLFAASFWLPEGALHHTGGDIETLLYSLFFVPHDRSTQSNPWPLLQVGWTLNYEMYFYTVFAAALMISKRFSQYICAAVIVIILIATQFFHPSSPAEGYYGDPIVLEFIFGMFVYQLFRIAPAMTTAGPSHNMYLLCGTCAILALGVLWLPYQEVMFIPSVHFITAGVAAAIILVAAIVLETKYSIFTETRWILILGEASYILYLVHQFVVFGIIRIGFKSAIDWPETIKWPLVALMLVVVSAVAMLLHLYIEKPVMKWLRARLIHEPPPVIFQST